MTHRLPYRADIDGLRALAVVSVVLCHADLGLPGGFVGVDVFFVISGFLITGLIQKQIASGSFSLADFWERRTRRILPALVVVVISTLAVGWFLLLPDAFASLGESVAGLSLLLSNVNFWQDTGYFAKAAEEKPLLHTWSLAVEEQFYLVVPLALVALNYLGSQRSTLLLIVTSAAASFVLSLYGTYQYPSATFYLLPTRAWELLAGSALATCSQRRIFRNHIWNEASAAMGLLLIIVPCIIYDTLTRFPGMAALPPVAGTVLLICSGTGETKQPSICRLLALRPVVFIGLISYSFYLWHWPVFAFARYRSLVPLSASESGLLVCVGLVLAILSWRFVEVPFRTGKLLQGRRRAMSFAILVISAGTVTGAIVVHENGFENRFSDQVRRLIATSNYDRTWHQQLDVGTVPDNLIKIGPADVAPKLLIWGDSHARALLPGFASLCDERGVAALAATHSGLLPVKGYYQRSEWSLNEKSIRINDSIMAIAMSRKFHTVVLAAKDWKQHLEVPECRKAFLETIDLLRQADLQVYFVNTVPTFEYDVPKSLLAQARAGKNNPSTAGLARSEHNKRHSIDQGILARLHECDVEVLDPASFFYGENNVFYPYDSNGTLYRDSHHLSTNGAMALKPLLEPMIAALVRDNASSDPRPADARPQPRIVKPGTDTRDQISGPNRPYLSRGLATSSPRRGN